MLVIFIFQCAFDLRVNVAGIFYVSVFLQANVTGIFLSFSLLTVVFTQ